MKGAIEEIQDHMYSLIFNKSIISKEIKIGFCFEKLEQYIPAPLRYFACEKYGHHKENCRGCLTCGRHRQKDPNYKLKQPREPPDIFKNLKHIQKKDGNCGGEVHKNPTFQEARKIVEFYMKVNHISM